MRPGIIPLIVAAGTLLPGRLAGQQPSADSLAAFDIPRLLQDGQSLHERLMPMDALQRFEEVVARDSLHYEARWKAAREAVNVGMMAEEGRQRDWYGRAETHARVAVTVRGDRVEGHHWLAVALGRRALEEGIRDRVRLAEAIRREALAVLALDSLHGGAHHVLGEWNAEVQRLSGIERWVAGNLLGGDSMGEASWDAARDHLERAVELEPRAIIHRLALARIYLDTDDEEAARSQLEEALALPVVEPTDPIHKQEAQELLAGMG